MRAPRPLAVVVVVVGGWSLACSVAYKPFDGDEPCLQVAYSISSVTFTCTGDEALANQRFHDFMASHTCNDGWKRTLDGIEPAFTCAAAVADLSCRDAEAFGDDLDAWLVDPGCAELFAPSDTGLPADTGGVR